MFGATAPDPVSTITTATSSLQGDLLQVGGVAVGVGAAILVLRRGWAFFKGLSK